jgi:hypothetical protein
MCADAAALLLDYLPSEQGSIEGAGVVISVEVAP